MLLIEHPERIIPKKEFFDNRTQEFMTIEEQRIPRIYLQLEHSLISVAKWESKWHVSFVGRKTLSGEELIDYIRCMTINQQKDPSVYNWLTQDDLNKIVEYMQDPQSAWTINNSKESNNKSPDTAEMYYYAMFQFGVPIDCEKWHFNRLIALLDFCNKREGSGSKSGPPAKKRSQKEIMEMYRALNEKNRKRFNSKG